MLYNENSISKLILQNKIIPKSVFDKWNSVKYYLIENHVAGETEISPVNAEKYRFDLYGLFNNVLFIQPEYIYPHIIVNGYTSSYDYNAELLRFKILDTTVLSSYYRLFMKDIKN